MIASNKTGGRAAPRRAGSAVALAVAGATAAIGLAFSLAPGLLERQAMGLRAAIERAETASASGAPREAAAILEEASRGRSLDAAAARTLLGYYAQARMLEEHFALLSGPSGRLFSAQDLRTAHRLYAANAQPDRATTTLLMLAARGWANNDELLLVARAHAAAGRTREAVAIARRIAADLAPGESPPAGVFVIDTLSRGGDPAGADAFAARWLDTSLRQSDVLAIASAILQSGNAGVAVEVLRRRRTDSDDAADAFDYALRVGAQTAPRLKAELTHDLLVQLPNATGEARTRAVHDLFAYGDFDAAQAELERTGMWRQDGVRDAFIAAMGARGREQRMRDLWLAEASGARPEITRRSARELAEAGFADTASGVLKIAAAQEGPGSGAINDLLYIWRAHAIAPDLAWLAERAAQATPAEAPLWIDHIAQAASPDAALGVLAGLQETARPEARSALAVTRARYLGWQGDSAALRSALADAASSRLTTAQAGEVLAIACAVGDGRSARQAAARLARSGGDRTAACLARIALADAREAEQRGDHAGAIAAFVEAAGFTTLSAQDNFDFGYSLESNGEREPARRRYELALAALPSLERSGERDMILRAAIVTRLGRPSEAGDILETLYAQNPTRGDLRVLLADNYVNRGAYRMALQLTAAN